MSIDVIGNFLTVIRNGLLSSKPFVMTQASRTNLAIAQILKEEGFIRDFALAQTDTIKKDIKIFLKYVNGESVIHEIVRKSKPSCRSYTGFKSIEPVIGGLGVSILTTNKGIITNKKAKELGVGGEVICTVW